MLQQGKQHRIVQLIQTAEGMFFGAVRAIVPLERKQKKGSESHEGVFKVELGEHILVCRMNHRQGVAPHCLPAPTGSRFLFVPSHTRNKQWKPLQPAWARCGDCTLLIQAHLIRPSCRHSSGSSRIISSPVNLWRH